METFALDPAYALKALTKAALLPPGLLFLALALAAIPWPFPKLRRLFRSAAVGIVLLILALSMPAVAGALQRSLVEHVPFDGRTDGAGAIVVLGAGVRAAAPEYGSDVPTGTALERLHYGADLARRTGLPILVSGGKPRAQTLAEAEAMAAVLMAWGVPARFIEAQSNDTAQNASFSATMLRAAGIGRVLLVTHANHMARAELAFRLAGLDVVPAPLGFPSTAPLSILDVMPQAYALASSAEALSHHFGILAYRLAGPL